VPTPVQPSQAFAELVALLKSRPGKFSYASAGVGTISHLLGEQFQLATGTQLNHVPYRGAAPAAQDVVAGVEEWDALREHDHRDPDVVVPDPVGHRERLRQLHVQRVEPCFVVVGRDVGDGVVGRFA